MIVFAAALLAGLAAAWLPPLPVCPDAESAVSYAFDQTEASAGFRVRAGALPVRGDFESLRGQLVVATDGSHACVHAELDADSVSMGSETLAGWARSEDFFDAARYPRLLFHSLPFDPAVLRRGGTIDGTLTLREIAKRTRLRAAAPRCSKAASVCRVTLRATVLRSGFGMRSNRSMVSDRVQLHLRFAAPPIALKSTSATTGR